MQSFPRRYLLAAPGYLDPIAEQDKLAVEPHQKAFAAGNDRSGPHAECIEPECTAMEAIQQSVAVPRGQSERTNDVGTPPGGPCAPIFPQRRGRTKETCVQGGMPGVGRIPTAHAP